MDGLGIEHHSNRLSSSSIDHLQQVTKAIDDDEDIDNDDDNTDAVEDKEEKQETGTTRRRRGKSEESNSSRKGSGYGVDDNVLFPTHLAAFNEEAFLKRVQFLEMRVCKQFLKIRPRYTMGMVRTKMSMYKRSKSYVCVTVFHKNIAKCSGVCSWPLPHRILLM